MIPSHYIVAWRRHRCCSISCVAFLLAVVPALKAQEQDKLNLTLEDIRVGLQSAWCQIQSRHVRLVVTPSGLPEGEHRVDHPARTEGEFTMMPDRRFKRAWRIFQDDKMLMHTIKTYDGRVGVQITNNVDAIETHAQMQGSADQTATLYETPALGLEYYNVPFHQYIATSSAAYVGQVEVDGHPCARVRVTSSEGSTDGSTFSFVIDVDPGKGFGIRRWEMGGLEGATRRGDEPPHTKVTAFAKWDALWYPRVIRRVWAHGGQIQYTYVIHAEFNRDYPESTFQPEFEAGTLVNDKVNGELYIAGGDHGRRKYRNAIKRAAMALPPDSGTPVSADQQMHLPFSQIFGVIGVVLLVAVILIHLRQRMQANQT